MGRIGILLSVILLLSPLVTTAADDPFSKLKELTRKAKETEGAYLSEEKKLKSIDGEISRIQDRTARVKENIHKRQRQVATYDKEIGVYENDLREAQARIRQEWVTLYKSASIDMVSAYYGHEKYSGYLNAVMEHHMGVLKDYQKLRQGLGDTRKKADELAALLQGDLRELQNTARDLENERRKKEILIASLKNESKMYQDRIENLLKEIQEKEKEKKEKEKRAREKAAREKRERERQKTLKEKAKKEPKEQPEKAQKPLISEGDFFRNKGMFPWPLKGKIVRRFGSFKVGGILQKSQGIDIETKDGAPVRCIFAGTVVFINWIEKFGNTVIVDHGGGYYSVYGHLQDTTKSVGQKVAPSEIFGRVGQSGTVLKPTLHFEIRLHQKALDPVLWLIRQ